jgi:hypothetical protein
LPLSPALSHSGARGLTGISGEEKGKYPHYRGNQANGKGLELKILSQSLLRKERGNVFSLLFKEGLREN